MDGTVNIKLNIKFAPISVLSPVLPVFIVVRHAPFTSELLCHTYMTCDLADTTLLVNTLY